MLLVAQICTYFLHGAWKVLLEIYDHILANIASGGFKYINELSQSNKLHLKISFLFAIDEKRFINVLSWEI